MTAFLKTTIIGGVLFLLPLAIVLMLLGYALRLASMVAQPITEKLQLQDWSEVAGIGLVTILSALVLVFVSFGAGITARTYVGRRLILLCHELGCLRWGFGRVQQGHRGALLTRATIRRRRRVAIELGM